MAVLGGLLYAIGGQDGVCCLNVVERFIFISTSLVKKMNGKLRTWLF